MLPTLSSLLSDCAPHPQTHLSAPPPLVFDPTSQCCHVPVVACLRSYMPAVHSCRVAFPAATGPPDACGLVYSLDSSSWSPCKPLLRVGPLAAGLHVLQVRCVDDVNVSTPVLSTTWAVVARSSYELQLDRLSDGNHSLLVRARDANGLAEADPVTRHFLVDTQPPTANATLLSPSPSKLSTAAVRLSCADALTVDGCWLVYVVRVFPVGGAMYILQTVTVPAEALPAPSHAVIVTVDFPLSDGAMDVVVTQVTDGADNMAALPVGTGVSVVSSKLWVRDLTPPECQVNLAFPAPLVPVPSLNTSVTNASTVDLHLWTSEAVVYFVVTISSAAESITVNRTAPPTAVLPLALPWDGQLTIAVVRTPLPPPWPVFTPAAPADSMCPAVRLPGCIWRVAGVRLDRAAENGTFVWRGAGTSSLVWCPCVWLRGRRAVGAHACRRQWMSPIILEPAPRTAYWCWPALPSCPSCWPHSRDPPRPMSLFGWA
jgi:hypothetical protein